MDSLKDIFRVLSKTDKRLLVSFSFSHLSVLHHIQLKHLKPRINGFELSAECGKEISSGNILAYEEQA